MDVTHSMKIRTHLPRWLGFKYMPNHHYVELEDSDGNKAHLPAHGIMHHDCNACRAKWWTESNVCSFCPSCGSQDVSKKWGRLQVAFMPEAETDFASMPLDTNDIEYSDDRDSVIPEMRDVEDSDTDPSLRVGGSVAEVTKPNRPSDPAEEGTDEGA